MQNEVENPDLGMEVRDLLRDPDFPLRKKRNRSSAQQLDAFSRLARAFADDSGTVLQELVNTAVEFCGADSSGISLEERTEAGEIRFRWVAIAGSFARYLNGTTPRFFSPCGTCLSRGAPQLYRVTKPYYDFLGVEAAPITDGILIPWVVEETRGTIWAVAHHSQENFDFEDYKLLESLAQFAGLAVSHHMRQKNLRMQEKDALAVRLVNDLAHQINNPLQSLTNAVYLAGQGGEDAQSFVKQASQELQNLSTLVKKLLSLQAAHEMRTSER